MPIGIGTAIGAIGGSLISGIFSSKQAESQMDFQERLSNTAVQRQVQDLKAAGINPILAARYGGASSPAGAMGTIPDLGASLSSAYNAATNRMGTESQIRLDDKTEIKLDWETNKLVEEYYLTNKQTEEVKERINLLKQQLKTEIERTDTEHARSWAVKEMQSFMEEIGVPEAGAVGTMSGIVNTIIRGLMLMNMRSN
jgi:hypothetical protein